MYKIRIYSFYTLLVLLLMSCTRVSEETAPWQLEAFPVVYSIITPDSVICVHLTSAFAGGKMQEIRDAQVYILEEDDNSTELTWQDSVFQDLHGAVRVERGKTYKLKIELSDGIELTAETTVPNEVAVFSEFSFIPLKAISSYQLSAYFTSKWTIPTANTASDNYIILPSWNWEINAIKTSDVDYEANSTRLIYPSDAPEYYISLYTTDIWLSRFLINKTYQANALTNGSDIISVIATEFSGLLPNFSNIENGVGMFGSYLLHVRDLEGNIIKQSK